MPTYLVARLPWKTGRRAPRLPAYQTEACSWPAASYRPALLVHRETIGIAFSVLAVFFPESSLLLKLNFGGLFARAVFAFKVEFWRAFCPGRHCLQSWILAGFYSAPVVFALILAGFWLKIVATMKT
jgi:hypothetical protein